VLTHAYNLPNKYVIHALGPVYGMDKPENVLLGDCYRNTLIIAEAQKIDSIAFPAISTGAFGYPFEAAADIALQTIIDMAPSLNYIRHIRFVLYGDIDYEIYVERLRFLKDQK